MQHLVWMVLVWLGYMQRWKTFCCASLTESAWILHSNRPDPHNAAIWIYCVLHRCLTFALSLLSGMRILVTLLLDTLPMLGNVLLLCFFVFFIFGIVGVQLWSGLLRNRCFVEDNFSLWVPCFPSLLYSCMHCLYSIQFYLIQLNFIYMAQNHNNGSLKVFDTFGAFLSKLHSMQLHLYGAKSQQQSPKGILCC